MTFKEMTDRVKFTLGAEEVVDNDEVVLIKKWLNDGLLQVLTRTRPYTRCINLNLSPNTAIHDMSNSILALLDMEIPEYGFLRRFSREDITRLQKTGGYGFAYEEPLLWISPIQTTAATIKAYGIFRPDTMVSDSADPTAPNFGGLAPEFHEAIVMYALWKTAEYVQHMGSQEGERWRIQYEGGDGTEGELARIKRTLTKRVTPALYRRRNLSGNLGVLSESGEYLGAEV
jgi:hypothetical protein